MERIEGAIARSLKDKEAGEKKKKSKVKMVGAPTHQTPPEQDYRTSAPAKPRTPTLKEASPIIYSRTATEKVDSVILEKNHIITHDKSDFRGVAYDQLRTHILQVMAENGWRTLAITSPTPECGKTVTAINLAYSISHLPDQSVLLVDFDLRRPSVAKYMGLSERPGISDYFAGNKSLEDILVNPGAERLVVMPNNEAMGGASEILGMERTRKLVQELRSRYENRKIIFDLPPILTTDDVLAFLPAVDAVLLVVASGKSTASEVDGAKRLIDHHPMVGSVLNFGHLENKGYY